MYKLFLLSFFCFVFWGSYSKSFAVCSPSNITQNGTYNTQIVLSGDTLRVECDTGYVGSIDGSNAFNLTCSGSSFTPKQTCISVVEYGASKSKKSPCTTATLKMIGYDIYDSLGKKLNATLPEQPFTPSGSSMTLTCFNGYRSSLTKDTKFDIQCNDGVFNIKDTCLPYCDASTLYSNSATAPNRVSSMIHTLSGKKYYLPSSEGPLYVRDGSYNVTCENSFVVDGDPTDPYYGLSNFKTTCSVTNGVSSFSGKMSCSKYSANSDSSGNIWPKGVDSNWFLLSGSSFYSNCVNSSFITQNATFSAPKTGFTKHNDSLVVTCNKGYGVFGTGESSFNAICKNGVFTNISACVKQCSINDKSFKDNFNYAVNDKGLKISSSYVGQQVTIKCADGFGVNELGQNSYTTKCTSPDDDNGIPIFIPSYKCVPDYVPCKTADAGTIALSNPSRTVRASLPEAGFAKSYVLNGNTMPFAKITYNSDGSFKSAMSIVKSVQIPQSELVKFARCPYPLTDDSVASAPMCSGNANSTKWSSSAYCIKGCENSDIKDPNLNKDGMFVPGFSQSPLKATVQVICKSGYKVEQSKNRLTCTDNGDRPKWVSPDGTEVSDKTMFCNPLPSCYFSCYSHDNRATETAPTFEACKKVGFEARGGPKNDSNFERIDWWYFDGSADMEYVSEWFNLRDYNTPICWFQLNRMYGGNDEAEWFNDDYRNRLVSFNSYSGGWDGYFYPRDKSYDFYVYDKARTFVTQIDNKYRFWDMTTLRDLRGCHLLNKKAGGDFLNLLVDRGAKWSGFPVGCNVSWEDLGCIGASCNICNTGGCACYRQSGSDWVKADEYLSLASCYRADACDGLGHNSDRSCFKWVPDKNYNKISWTDLGCQKGACHECATGQCQCYYKAKGFTTVDKNNTSWRYGYYNPMITNIEQCYNNDNKPILFNITYPNIRYLKVENTNDNGQTIEAKYSLGPDTSKVSWDELGCRDGNCNFCLSDGACACFSYTGLSGNNAWAFEPLVDTVYVCYMKSLEKPGKYKWALTRESDGVDWGVLGCKDKKCKYLNL